MRTLRENLFETSAFLVGVELVSIRGSMAGGRAGKVRDLATELAAAPDLDWISITDNAGGNPQLAPQALGKPILYAGKEVVIHLTCKDLNRNGLESAAWQLNSEGFHNVLAMTGDYPTGGNEGNAKPVFDLDSVGLISLLDKMNRGFSRSHQQTGFCIGAVTSNHKLLEGEVIPQYRKLAAKVACGAHFIINQVGYDCRKARELRHWMDEHGMAATPLIGNAFVLSIRTARMFHERRIPGVVVSDELLARCEREAASPDAGRAFFLELAAQQMAVFRGLGYRGVYLGGLHDVASIERVRELERGYGPDDWRQFDRAIRYSRPGEYFACDDPTGASPGTPGVDGESAAAWHAGVGYSLAKWAHHAVFTPGHGLARLGARMSERSADPMQGPWVMRAAEKLSKSMLFGCRDCGDCSLPDVAFLCPESSCAKNQRNGPCGGTRDGQCEVQGFGDCIWLRAYQRRKHDGTEQQLLDHAPVIQDQGLRGTSAWANTWLGRDHTARRAP